NAVFQRSLSFHPFLRWVHEHFRSTIHQSLHRGVRGSSLRRLWLEGIDGHCHPTSGKKTRTFHSLLHRHGSRAQPLQGSRVEINAEFLHGSHANQNHLVRHRHNSERDGRHFRSPPWRPQANLDRHGLVRNRHDVPRSSTRYLWPTLERKLQMRPLKCDDI
ncbi:unnamed protein product, partial [Scytosiphon promiscuus]